MPSMEALEYNQIFGLLKGEPGTRKSTQALSFPGPQYWYSHDKKMQSLILPMKNWGIKPNMVEYDNYTDFQSMQKKMDEQRLNCKYKTIILDSITSMADSTNAQTIKFKTGTTTKGGEEKGLRVGGISVNSMEDYKAEKSAFMQMIAAFKDIQEYHGVHIVLIAHVIGERNKEQSSGSTHFSRIIATGGKAISALIPAYCTEVYHFNIEQEIQADKEGKYGLITVHTGEDFARTALPLPNKILFGNEPIFDKYLAPAMKKLKETKTVEKF